MEHIIKQYKSIYNRAKEIAMENNIQYLIEMGIATEEEINLVTKINGYTGETLNDILYVRTGYRSFEQIQGEEE